MATQNNSPNGAMNQSPTAQKMCQIQTPQFYDHKGTQAIMDLYGIKRELLVDCTFLEKLARDAASAANATVEGPLLISTPPDGGGPSFTMHLLQSHGSGHAWPETTITIKGEEGEAFKRIEGYMYLDFATCGVTCDPIKACVSYILGLQPSTGTVTILPTGENPDAAADKQIKVYALDDFKRVFRSEFDEVSGKYSVPTPADAQELKCE